MGGLLSITVAGGANQLAIDNPSLRSFVIAILFPVNLVIITVTGGLLFTGATFTTPAAWLEGKANLEDVFRVIGLSWCGNMIGGILFALLVHWCGLLVETGPANVPVATAAGKLFLSLTKKKISLGWSKVVARGIGCNWLVCMAVYLASMSDDFLGKFVAVYMCISAFIACGFEHYPANAFTFPCGVIVAKETGEYDHYGNAALYGTNNTMEFDVIWNNVMPASVGNWISGTFCMSLALSTIYGSMFKKVDRFLNLNHLSNCATIRRMFGSTVRARPRADLESGAKPKVVNVVDVTKLVKVVSATPTQFVSAGGIPAIACTIRDSATADNATDLDEGSVFRSSTDYATDLDEGSEFASSKDSLPQLPPSSVLAKLREAKQE
jgi:formate/nitrite transporter